MANINKNALISITRGKSTGFSRIRFNIPEEAKYTFPVNELFKMDVVGFNITNIDFKEEANKQLILMETSITRSKLLKAIFSFAVHSEIYSALKILLANTKETPEEDEDSISLIKKVIETYPPIIQIIPKNQ